MSVPRPGRFPVILKPGCVGPGVTGQYQDDHRMRESFAAMLNRAPTLRCVSAYATAEESVLDMPNVKPDVALVDIHLPGMDGIECVAKLKRLLPHLQHIYEKLHVQSRTQAVLKVFGPQ